jgi:hypothetical protein
VFHESGTDIPKPRLATVKRSPAPKAPLLTHAQESAARAAIAGSPALSRLAREPGVSMLVVTWQSNGGEALGTGVDLRWPKPRVVTGTWPAMAYDQTETIMPPYQVTTAHIRATNVTGVHVQVDLTGKIVDIHPLPGADVSVYSVDERKIHLPPQPKRLD